MRFDKVGLRALLSVGLTFGCLQAQNTVVGKKSSADEARQIFLQTLDAVNDAWFGKPYQSITTARLKGSLGSTLSGAVIDQKIDSDSDNDNA